ncbi:hypothetical protein ES705_48813 [subsurface metagenome]
MSFRACVYPSLDDKGHFIAHCLELDVVGEGANVEDAISELLEVIETQFESCRETGAQFQFFAPAEAWHKYQLAKKANRRIAGELLERVVKIANRRLGHNISPSIFDNIVGTKEIPSECLAMV